MVTKVSPRPTRAEESTRPSVGSRRALIGLEIFAGLGAVYGAYELYVDAWGLSADLLKHTPFDTWRWPGVMLLVVVAVPMLAAAALELAHSSWAFITSLLAGLALAGWIVVQLLVMGYQMTLQPIMLATGLAVAWLAWVVHPAGSRDYYR